jgi:ribosomal protein S18 acetylase RimI-like enzyme
MGSAARCELSRSARVVERVVIVRTATPADAESALDVWRRATLARRDGKPMPPEAERRTRGSLGKPDAFGVVVDDGGAIVGVGLAMQGRDDDGAGPPRAGLCHVAMVFVAPERWGAGIGGRIVDALVESARTRGYECAQLWTQDDNARAHRLYVGRGFLTSGRRKIDENGDSIVHFERAL